MGGVGHVGGDGCQCRRPAGKGIGIVGIISLGGRAFEGRHGALFIDLRGRLAVHVPGDGVGLGPALLLVGNAGGRGHFGDRLAEHQPGKLRVVDKDVPIALDLFGSVVAAHFPGVHRVVLAPLQQNVQALYDFRACVFVIVFVKLREVVRHHIGIEVGLLPAHVDIEQNTGHVALDVVIGLVIGSVQPAAGIALFIIISGAVGGVAVGMVVVYILIDVGTGRAQMVAVGAAVDLLEGGAGLGPDVLPVEVGAAPCVQAAAPDVAHFAFFRTGDGIRVSKVGAQGIIAVAFCLGGGHQRIQRVVQRVVLRRVVGTIGLCGTGQGRQLLISIAARIIGLGLGGKRGAGLAAGAVVVDLRPCCREYARQHGQNHGQHQQKNGCSVEKGFHGIPPSAAGFASDKKVSFVTAATLVLFYHFLP